MKYMTPAEVARVLNISTRQLRRMRQTEGDGPEFVTFGTRTVRYAPASVARWLDEHRG